MRCNYIFCDGPKACASRNDGRPLRPCWTVTERPRRCITEYGVRTARPPYIIQRSNPNTRALWARAGGPHHTRSSAKRRARCHLSPSSSPTVQIICDAPVGQRPPPPPDASSGPPPSVRPRRAPWCHNPSRATRSRSSSRELCRPSTHASLIPLPRNSRAPLGQPGPCPRMRLCFTTTLTSATASAGPMHMSRLLAWACDPTPLTTSYHDARLRVSGPRARPVPGCPSRPLRSRAC